MTESEQESGQLALLPQLARAKARSAKGKPAPTGPLEPAPELPVARVLVDVPLAHLDRPFDYAVPAKLHEQVRPGSRVKVRFAGQDVDGFVLERLETSDHEGRLAPIRRAVSAERVLSPEVARLSASVAARYAGTRSDVLRLAVPSRHAATEKQESAAPARVAVDLVAAGRLWAPYVGGTELVETLAGGHDIRRVWQARAGEDWAEALAQAAAATYSSGRGSILCVPDHRDLVRLDAALERVLGVGAYVVLSADQGPAKRYRSFLAVSRGAVKVVAGTRSAAFAPVHDLGLVAIWDDGDDLYAEPRAPYPHTREVLLLRAHEESCSTLIGGFACSVESANLLGSSWAGLVSADREGTRAAAPQVSITGATDVELSRDPFARTSRIPSSAHAAIRQGLLHGPVLVQTPRQGYASSLVCETCRSAARCRVCQGPLHLTRPHLPPTCRWCGAEEPGRACPVCGSAALRAPVVGDRRTAEELGRAFPSVPVLRSSGERVVAEVGAKPAIVVATPGAEPVATGGYATVVLLDTWLMLARPDLRTAEESLRRWFNAAALARSAAAGGRVVAVGDPADPALQALVRWDPVGFADRELAERQSAHLPPASRLAVLSGDDEAVTAALDTLVLPAGAEVLGPVPVAPARPDAAGTAQVRAVVRVPRRAGAALSRALVELQGVRAARKLPPVRVQVDPHALE